MKKEEYQELLNTISSTGCDFSEIYYEDSISKMYRVFDSKLDDININTTRGIGMRMVKDGDTYYASSNNIDFEFLNNQAQKLSKNIKGKNKTNIQLGELEELYPDIKIPHDNFDITKKKEILLNLDKKIREYSNLVTQVNLAFVESDKKITVVNNEGKYIKSASCITRFYCMVYTEKDKIKETNFIDSAAGKGYEFLDELDLEKAVIDCARIAVEKLDAKNFKGGELPVVICPGFGAVIFHEACGHGLEATSVEPKLSVFSNDLHKKIASEKVTLVDDGTIEGYWGSNLIDDEGNLTKRNILIKDGILNEFLVDKINAIKMKQKSNGCGRRESYLYPPTSRMSNTYILPGNDKVDDMIKSINLGVFCERMSGGSVNPATGEFNFAVASAFLIEKGKLTKRIKEITLIGTSKEILENVEMVSDDLEISAGYCGSKSGTIPVTIGQPTIKVSKILVGGKE